MPDPVPQLSLVILCYRSEDYAREFALRAVEVMRSIGLEDYELVLVGNYVEGKGDRTPDVVRELAASDERILCCAEPKQGWMGWDMRMGLAAARGRCIGVIDGDGQMPIGDVGKLYELMQAGGYELVKTYRVSRGDGFKRRLLSTVYNVIFRLLFPGLNARDMNAKPKLFTRDAYERMRLESNGWFVDAEIMIEARHLGLAIGELPTDFGTLADRRSFVRLGAIFEFLRELARYRLREFGRKRPKPGGRAQ